MSRLLVSEDEEMVLVKRGDIGGKEIISNTVLFLLDSGETTFDKRRCTKIHYFR